MDGKQTKGGDCATIPGAENTMGTKLAPERYCGRSKGLVKSDDSAAVTVCSKFPGNYQHLIQL